MSHQLYPNPAGGGSGSDTDYLTTDSDVSVMDAVTGDVLVFNQSLNLWVNAMPALATLLQDVAISGPVNNDVLTYNASIDLWVNKPIGAILGSSITLEELADVSPTGIVNGDVLTWNASLGMWVATPMSGGGGSSTLAADTDVSITSPADGDLLTYASASSKWQNKQLVAGANVTITDSAGAVTIAASGGGGSGVYPTMTQPVIATFTWRNQGAATAVDKTSRLVVSVPDSYASITGRGLFANIPTAPYTLTVACSIVGILSTNNAMGFNIGLRDGSGNWITFGVFFGSTDYSYYAQRNIWSSDGATYVSGSSNFNSPAGAPLVWLRLIDDGTSRLFYISSNGQDWGKVVSESNTTGITPTQIGLAFYYNAGGISPAPVAQFSVFNYVIANSVLPTIGA